MTIITYRDGILAADTLVTGDEGRLRRGYTSKLARSPGGVIGAGAGAFTILQSFLHLVSSGKIDEWIAEGFKDRLKLEAEAEAFEAILITAEGKVIKIDWRGAALVGADDPYHALGGAAWPALGAMAAGASAPEAAQIAMQLDTHCGGRIETLALNRIGNRAVLDQAAPLQDRDERAEEARVLDVGSAYWPSTPYSVALEIKRLIGHLIDEGTSIDSGHGVFWPPGAPEAIVGHAEADLWPRIGGAEFYISIRKSNNQLLKEGVTRAQLGLGDEPPPGMPGTETPRR